MANHAQHGSAPPHTMPKMQPYHPVTFRERGVAVPFTTPLLAGARARPGARAELELVIPNLSGGKGVYVMPWQGVSMLCRPTLHDRLLSERIVLLQSFTPAEIRKAGRAVAAEGFAGEDASMAARLANESERSDRLVTNYQLLMVLVSQQAGGAGVAARHLPGTAASGIAPSGDTQLQARTAVARIAPRVGKPVVWVSSALETLAGLLSDVGVDGSGAAGRCERLASMLREHAPALRRGAWNRTTRTSQLTPT